MAEGGQLRVIILGATSAIAAATARLYAEEDKASLLLVGRNENRLSEMAMDLRARGASRVQIETCELVTPHAADRQLATFVERLGGVDHILLAYGLLGDHARAMGSQLEAETILAVNFTSVALWSLSAANILETQGHGALVVFGSVAGDRGRRGNFVYGAAKAGIAALVEGIAHHFAGKGPRAVLIKIGPTVTPMTAHLEKKKPRKGPLWATPQQVAAVVHARAARGGPIAYAPRRWRFIMAIIRHMPGIIFNRLDI